MRAENTAALRYEGSAVTGRQLLYALMFLPFFEPLSINIYIRLGINAGVFGLIGDLFLLGRLAVTAWAVLTYFRRIVLGETSLNIVTVLILLNLAAYPFSGLMNGSLTVKIIAEYCTYMGFVLFFTLLLERAPSDLLMGGIICFGTLSVLGAASILAFPKGLIPGVQVEGASGFRTYYFLGAKNTAFPYYFAFLSFLIARYGIRNKLLPRIAVPIAVFIVTARVCDSSSTTICLLLMFGFYLLSQYAPKLMRRIRPKVTILVLIAVLLLIYMGLTFDPFVRFLKLFGRGTTFSGRVLLWKQAIRAFKAHPLFGAGSDLSFKLMKQIVTHAHSQYLNRLAKTGGVPFVLMAASVIAVIRSLERSRDRLLSALMGALLVIYMLHMGFDDYTYNFFTLILLLCAHMADTSGGRIRRQLIIRGL